MNRIPCKKCPQCGLYHDFTVVECACGKKLTGIEAQFVDTDALAPEQCGRIDTSRKAFVQKCSACGALNYTDDPAHPVRICFNCHKARIASIVPVACEEEGSDEDEISPNGGVAPVQAPEKQTPPQSHTDEEDDEDDDDVVQWQGLLGNIRKTVGGAPETQTGGSGQSGTGQATAPQTTGVASGSDADREDIGDRSGIPGATPGQSKAPDPKQRSAPKQAKKDITLTAVRYGRLSFTVRAGQDAYMLGRSANQGTFLSQDRRVGNEHCYLSYRDGTWFVKDNHSSNGTAVNSRDIGLNGECVLSDGDELKLGHHPDSMAFRIAIK